MTTIWVKASLLSVYSFFSAMHQLPIIATNQLPKLWTNHFRGSLIQNPEAITSTIMLQQHMY